MTSTSKDASRTVAKKGKRSLSQYITPKDVYSKKVRDSQSSGVDGPKRISSSSRSNLSDGTSFGSQKSAGSSVFSYTQSTVSEETPEDIEAGKNAEEMAEEQNNNTEERDEDFMIEMSRVDREFLDHQILLLSTPFPLPEMAKSKFGIQVWGETFRACSYGEGCPNLTGSPWGHPIK